MADRADHYRWADELIWKVRRQIKDGGRYTNDELTLMTAAAQVHATLAACGPGVEQAVRDNEARVAKALGAAEGTQKARQAARQPLAPHRAAASAAVQDAIGKLERGIAGDLTKREPWCNCEEAYMCHQHRDMAWRADQRVRPIRTDGDRPKPHPPVVKPVDDPGHPK